MEISKKIKDYIEYSDNVQIVIVLVMFFLTVTFYAIWKLV